MSWIASILGEQGNENQLIYVIAVLVLAAGSALFEKLKKKMAESQDRRKESMAPPLQRPATPAERTVPMPQRGAPPVQAPPRRPAVPPVRTDRPRPPQPMRERPVPPVARPQPSVSRPQPRPPAPQRRPQPQAPKVPVPPPKVPVAAPRVPDAPAPLPSQTLAPARLVVEGERKLGESIGESARKRQVLADTARVDASVAATVAAALRKPTLVELRRAIVLSEILSPPLALREDPSSSVAM